MYILLAVFGAIFLTTFSYAPTMGAGWAWDAGNALGFAAFGGMLYLTLPTDYRRNGRTHELLGYAVLAVALAHAFWFLLWDGAAVEFIKPGAPMYMWIGIASLVLLFLLVTLAMLPNRLKTHRNYQAFKYWHQVIAIFAIATAIYHIEVSDFYLSAWYQKLLLIALAVVLVFSRTFRINVRSFPLATPAVFLTMSVAGATLFAAIRNFL